MFIACTAARVTGSRPEPSMLGANWAPAALLLLLAAAATVAAADEPLEDEVESAPFAIVVEHEDGWRCGGALVTLRAALSTATCARGRGAPPADLWARAPGATAAEGARRVARIALAIDSQGLSENMKWTEEAWIGVVLDMALLELEAPFGAAAGARPILMAAGDDCEPRGSAPACHVVRTPQRAGGALRVGNAERASPMVCATVAPHWAAISDTALCLVGPEFCQSDWGVGVVCAGKLCGVLSRSARSPGESGENSSESGGESGGGGGGGGGAGCGDTHAALLVPRWQQFVHCAQTRRHCGRDSCASVCSERMLLNAPVKEEGGLTRPNGKHHARHRSTTAATAPEAFCSDNHVLFYEALENLYYVEVQEHLQDY
ncbi:trypsin-7-like [Cydia splendana]|uniref:trypsin-7-like n=1 Tax=Cydia splendana TaxID=1100963 RepID=UPI00300CD0AB